MRVSRNSNYVTYTNTAFDKANNDVNKNSVISSNIVSNRDFNSKSSGVNPSGDALERDVLTRNNSKETSSPATYMLDFKEGRRFNLEGATRDYEDINVGKALSDMKKDAILDKYKFFVDSPNLGKDSDGAVRIVTNWFTDWLKIG